MEVFILNTVLFYLFYWIYRCISEDDIILQIYRSEMESEDEKIVELIKLTDNEYLRDEVLKPNKKTIEGIQNALKEVEIFSNKHKRLDDDKNYRKYAVIEYRQDLRRVYATESIKRACAMFLSELWVLVPAIFYIATGSIFITILAVMANITIYSLKRVSELAQSVIYFEGEDTLKRNTIRFSIATIVFGELLVRSGYFITYLVITKII